MAESVQKVKVEPVEFVEDRKLGTLGTVGLLKRSIESAKIGDCP